MLLQAFDAEQLLAHGCGVGPRPAGGTLERELKNWMHGRLSGRRGTGGPTINPPRSTWAIWPSWRRLGALAQPLSGLLGSPHRCRGGPGYDRGCRDCRHRFLLGFFQFPVAALLLFSCHGVLLLLDVGPLLLRAMCSTTRCNWLAYASGKEGDLQDAGVNQREAEGSAHSVTTADGGMGLHFKAPRLLNAWNF